MENTNHNSTSVPVNSDVEGRKQDIEEKKSESSKVATSVQSNENQDNGNGNENGNIETDTEKKTDNEMVHADTYIHSQSPSAASVN